MSVDADQFFDTLNFVLHFLQEEGFNKAEDSLRQELAARFEFADNQVSTSDTVAEDDIPDSHGGSPVVDEVDSQWPVAEPDSVVFSPQAAHKPSTSEPHRLQPPAHRSSASHHDEVDEYDSMDDPGYYRKDVVNQQRFIDTELILDDDEEGFHEHADPISIPPIPGSGSPVSSSGSLQYSSERAQSNSPLSIPTGSAVDDESWELGPADIRLVEPVTAPGQSSTDAAAPTLRRVESLSNSFKDDGDAPDSCGNSFVDSENETSGDKGFTIDLAPPASQPPELQNVFDSLDAGTSSRHSSPDLQQLQPAEHTGADAVPKNPLSIQTPANRDEAGVGGGGFSFPITPPTSEPDQLFSSWPSFRSPTSETSPDMGGTVSDDEGTAAGAPGGHAAVDGEDASTSGRPELLAHMISLSAEDEQGSERYAEESDGEDDAASKQQQRAQPQPAGEWNASGPSRPFAPPEPVAPQYILDEDQRPIFIFNEDYISRKYETLSLKVIHRRSRTGFEETKDFPIRINDLIAGRYQIMDTLGSAAFSRAVQALDIKTGALVCLKIIKNNKDYFDQSLDEIKLLHHVNTMDPSDEHGIVRLFDYFYYKEHLFLVCELLRANLYEFQKFNRESGDPPYFTLGRIQKIANQVLRSLAFVHSLGLIHSDLKPENILIKSYSNCEVKVIDLGSSCFTTDHLSSYVQSRSYRAPEVILGLPYDQKIDIWSLGCILAELSSGFVLFQNDSLATLLARLEGILGPVPSWMVHQSKYGPRFYTRSGMLYELNPHTKRYEILVPKRTSLRHRMPDADRHFTDFVRFLLAVDPNDRPTAEEALRHPWLQHPYPLD